MPAHTQRPSRAPRAAEINPAQIGCVQTNAVAVAMLVSFTLGTHVPK